MSDIGEGSDALSTQQRRAVAALMTGVVLANLDTAIANTALPTIAGDLHAAAATSVWVVNA